MPVKSGLEGAISSEGSLKPWSPFGPGTSVESSLTPLNFDQLERAAKEHEVDPDLLDALVQTESAYQSACEIGQERRWTHPAHA